MFGSGPRGQAATARHAFSYDSTGNMTRETLNGADLRLYEYDAEGRLSRAQLVPAAPFSNHTYDADGQLVKVSGPKNVVYIDGIYEKNLDTGVVTKYYFAGGQRVAMRTSGSPDVVRYLANDHLGSTAFVMNSSGMLEAHVRYYPYGMTWTQSATPATDRLFTGHQQMGAQSGTYYANARFYSADIGRFPQPDSILPDVFEPQALSRYTYVANNPMNYTDPSGHDSVPGFFPGCGLSGGCGGGGGGGGGSRPPPDPYGDPTRPSGPWALPESQVFGTCWDDGPILVRTITHIFIAGGVHCAISMTKIYCALWLQRNQLVNYDQSFYYYDYWFQGSSDIPGAFECFKASNIYPHELPKGLYRAKLVTRITAPLGKTWAWPCSGSTCTKTRYSDSIEISGLADIR